MPLLRAQYPDANVVFIDDGLAPGMVNGHVIIDWYDFLNLSAKHKAVAIAVAYPRSRQKIADKCHDANIPLLEVRANTVTQMDDVKIGDGACLSPYVTLTSNIRIGRCFHANLYSYVEHDCVIGDFVTFAPGAKINGNVTIGNHVYIGAGAIIRQGINIGAGAVIGMGAVVTRDVVCQSTVVGNPAKPLKKD